MSTIPATLATWTQPLEVQADDWRQSGGTEGCPGVVGLILDTARPRGRRSRT
ncbi:MAG: hypothetical protein QOE58_921, partial [Actinomycetota bacterium]|nr:hypothetical protein [Actinomycetota bacterium]